MLSPVDPVDTRLHLTQRRNWPAVHQLPPCTEPADALAHLNAVERPDVCTLHCWRHGGTGTCICEEDEDGTTSNPDGW